MRLGGHAPRRVRERVHCHARLPTPNRCLTHPPPPQPFAQFAEQHYADLAGKKFFPSLIEYIISGPVCAMVWEGLNVVKTGRVMLGATNPADSAPGTIRGDYCIDIGRNICHGSDAVEAAEKEIALWFPEGTITWADHSEAQVYE